jgi:hypothetical protein
MSAYSPEDDRALEAAMVEHWRREHHYRRTAPSPLGHLLGALLCGASAGLVILGLVLLVHLLG